jgi:hypothetical protein
MMCCNFTPVLSKLRMPPAMAAGASERLLDVSDLVALV